MFAVINHLHLSVPVAQLRQQAEQDLGALLDSLPGCQGFYLVQVEEQHAVVVILWDTPEHAMNGAQTIGPGWFNRHVAPYLSTEQQRSLGEVVWKYSPA